LAFSLHDSSYDSDYSSTVTESCDIAVTSGDLIVVCAGNNDDLDITNIADDAGNSYTLLDQLDGGSTTNMRCAYCLSANSTSTVTVTATFSAGTVRRSIIAASFTPTGGTTVSLDCTANAVSGYEASPWETDADSSTTGTDEVAVAFFKGGTGTTYTNHEIPGGTGADAVPETIFGLVCFYSVLSEGISNIYAEVDPSETGYYVAELLCFKSVAGGSSNFVPIWWSQRGYTNNG